VSIALHKTSWFLLEEDRGFGGALRDSVPAFDLIWLAPRAFGWLDAGCTSHGERPSVHFKIPGPTHPLTGSNWMQQRHSGYVHQGTRDYVAY
jgi:hypothetical protein